MLRIGATDGQRWESAPRCVCHHDFRTDSIGVAIPYGSFAFTCPTEIAVRTALAPRERESQGMRLLLSLVPPDIPLPQQVSTGISSKPAISA